MYESPPLHERDRRWSALRSAMTEAGLDGLLVPIGNGVDSRYLTLVRGSAFFLVADLPDPVVIMDQGQSNTWVPEPRATVRSWATPTVDAIRSTGLSTGVIGIAGLEAGEWTHVDAGDGAVIHGPLVAVIEAFPRIRFVDATDVVGKVRALKSPVEIALLSEAASHARSGVTAVANRVESGVTSEELLAAGVGRILELGSEFRTSRVRILRPDATVADTCTPGSVVYAEITGCVSGYTVTETDSFLVGASTREWDLQVELFARTKSSLLDDLRIGATAHRLLATAAEMGATNSAAVTLEIQALGLGGDGPVVSSLWHSKGALTKRFEEGMCFALTLEIKLRSSELAYRSSFSTVLVDGRPQSISPYLSVDVSA